jgi:hypothetical protein
MKSLKKGDTILNKWDNKKYVVDYVECIDEMSVVFTDGTPCKCIPLSEVMKVPNNPLSDYFIRLFKKEKLTTEEENDLSDRLKKLKPVTILPTDPDFINRFLY